MELAPGVLAHGQLDMPAGVRAAGPAAQGDVSAGQAQVVGVEVGRRQSLYLRPGRRDAGADPGEIREGEFGVHVVLLLSLDQARLAAVHALRLRSTGGSRLAGCHRRWRGPWRGARIRGRLRDVTIPAVSCPAGRVPPRRLDSPA